MRLSKPAGAQKEGLAQSETVTASTRRLRLVGAREAEPAIQVSWRSMKNTSSLTSELLGADVRSAAGKAEVTNNTKVKTEIQNFIP